MLLIGHAQSYFVCANAFLHEKLNKLLDSCRVFCCGANTHNDPIYQKQIRLALVKALCDFVDDDAKANSLRQCGIPKRRISLD